MSHIGPIANAKYSLELPVLVQILIMRPNHWSYNNIAGMDAQHSDCGLFPNPSQRLLLTVTQKYLANGSEPLVFFRNSH